MAAPSAGGKRQQNLLKVARNDVDVDLAIIRRRNALECGGIDVLAVAILRTRYRLRRRGFYPADGVAPTRRDQIGRRAPA